MCECDMCLTFHICTLSYVVYFNVWMWYVPSTHFTFVQCTVQCVRFKKGAAAHWNGKSTIRGGPFLAIVSIVMVVMILIMVRTLMVGDDYDHGEGGESPLGMTIMWMFKCPMSIEQRAQFAFEEEGRLPSASSLCLYSSLCDRVSVTSQLVQDNPRSF